MQNRKMDLPVMVMHSIDDVQYKIAGKLQSINEAAETCTVIFGNGRVAEIPIESIFITEGVWSKIKEFGQKAMSWIVKKVKGFIAFCAPDGSMTEDSYNNMPNRLIAQSEGDFPDCVKFFPAQLLTKEVSDYGITVDVPDDSDFCKDAIAREAAEFNDYWHRVMERTATNDESVVESIQYVNETYYKNQRAPQLNEGVPAINSVTDLLGRAEQEGRTVNRKQLVREIEININAQLNYASALNSGQVGFLDKGDEYEKLFNRELIKQCQEEYDSVLGTFYKKLLIWGAPGIGKTAMISQVLTKIKVESQGKRNLHLYEVTCNNISEDSFILPTMADKIEIQGSDGKTVEITNKTFVPGALYWLPVYTKGTPEHNALMERYFSSCCHLSADRTTPILDKKGKQYTGGVIFLDEIMRAQTKGFTSIMSVCRGNIQGKVLAGSWAVIAAANRIIDSPNQGALDAINDNAISDTFNHVAFVPTREEWLEWAESPTNKRWKSQVDPAIIEFIRVAPEYCWYRAGDLGGFDNEIKAAVPESGFEGGSGREFTYELLKSINRKKPEENPFLNSRVTWNPRDITMMSVDLRNAMMELFRYDSVDPKTGELIEGTLRHVGEIDKSKAGKFDNNMLYDYDHMLIRAKYGPEPKDPEQRDIYFKTVFGVDKDGKPLSEEEKKKYRYKYTSVLIPEKEYKRALTCVKPSAYNRWVKAHFDEDEAKKILSTPFDRLVFSDVVSQLLINIAKRQTQGDDTLFVQQLQDYFSWREIFDTDVIDSIYQTGFMPMTTLKGDKDSKEDKKIQAMTLRERDMKNLFVWKKGGSNSVDLIKKIVEYILENYPGDINRDAQEYINMTSNFVKEYQKYVNPKMTVTDNNIVGIQNLVDKYFPLPDGMDLDSVYSELHKIFEFRMNVKKEPEFYFLKLDDIYKSKSKYTLQAIYWLYVNSNLYRHIINYVKYVGGCIDYLTEKTTFVSSWANEDRYFKQMLKKFAHMNDTGINNINTLTENLKNAMDKNAAIFGYIHLIDIMSVVKSISSAAVSMSINRGKVFG